MDIVANVMEITTGLLIPKKTLRVDCENISREIARKLGSLLPGTKDNDTDLKDNKK